MEDVNLSDIYAAASPSASPFTYVPSHASPAASAYITCIGLHPVEPFQAVGLSSGEVCLYTCSTDALSWLVEMDAARQDQLRFDQAMIGRPTSNTHSTGTRRHTSGSSGGAVAVAPPDHPLKVLSFAPIGSSSAAAGGHAILHCGFLRGREDDLLRELVRPKLAELASLSSSLPSVARHLLYVVTNANDIFVVDIKSEVVLVRWCASAAARSAAQSSRSSGKAKDSGGLASAASATSPLHSKLVPTQVETFGALLFITVAHRSAVQAASAALGKSDVDSGRGPECNALDHCNEPLAYVLHLGYTNPFAAATSSGLVAGGGAYLIKAVSQDRRKLRDPAHSSSTAPPARTSLSIRAHPFAPLLLLLLNRAEVQVFAVDGDESGAAPLKAQLVLFHSSLSSTALRGSAGPSSATPPAPLLDAHLLPSAAVLARTSPSARASPSKRRAWGSRNVQILLLSSTRLRLVCTHPASTGEAAAQAGTVAVDRAFYTAPEMGVPPSPALSSTAAHSQVCFVRAWTWLASPDTLFVLQSDRTLLELSCNDLIAASMEVPSVRSRRLLPPRTMGARASPETGKDATHNRCSSCVQQGDWWLIPPTASGLPCASLPHVLPLWGRGSVLSGVFAPCLPAYHSEDPQTLVFSRLTGLTRPLPIPQTDAADSADANHAEREPVDGAQHSTLHLSLLADTETVSSRCISIRLCLTPQHTAAPATPTTASNGASAILAQLAAQESVNVTIARVLCESAAPALCRLEHGFYFVGSREESAYSDYPFVIAGLQYVDSVVQDGNDTSVSDTVRAAQAQRNAQLRVAMVCLPADRCELRRLYSTAKASCCNGSSDGCGAFTPSLTLPTELKRTLQNAVHHAQVQTLPIPQFEFELPYVGRMTKQLLSCTFQLSNDGMVPCVWGLWAPVFPYSPTTATVSVSATLGSPLPPPQSLQLTMQSFYVSAESQQLLWRPPELVQMDELLASNPSQVFALSSVLTKGGCTESSAVTAGLPALYKTVDDALMDVDAAVVARLFLYYADRKVLVLATVETGSSREGGFNAEIINDAYNFASRLNKRNGRGHLFAGEATAARASEPRGNGRQYLRLVPHAAAEMNNWKGDNTAESLSCTLLSAVQLSAVMVNDHGEPALQVAVASRRFGVALALFPLAGRRGIARVSATLQPVKVYLYRQWDELMCVTAAVTQQAEESEPSGQDASGDRGSIRESTPSSMWHRSPTERKARTATTALGLDDVQASPLLRRYRTWVDTVAYPSTAYASIPLMQWVWPPAWSGMEVEEGEESKTSSEHTAMAAAAANPILLLQRGSVLYVLHLSGAAVQVCHSLLHCSPLHIVSRAATPTLTKSPSSPSAPCELYLQHGSYPGLLARSRLLRQLQLQYGPYSLYVDATVSSQSPARKRKWFKKFLKSTNCSEAARRRARELPQQMAWLKHVYAPSADGLAYQFTSPSKSNGSGDVEQSPTQVKAALERLVGTGVTHVGNILDVNFTDAIRLATLAVEALAASHGMQQLVSAAGMLTDSLRNTLRHLTMVLKHSIATGNNSCPHISGREGAPMVLIGGNWAVAEALARLPLSSVVHTLGQEVRRAAAAATAAVGTSCGSARGDNAGGVRDRQKRELLADLQRWWWLLMRCSTLVTAVNANELDTTSRVMADVFEELPLSSPLLQPPPDEEAATYMVTQALLLCPPRFMPHVITLMLESGTRSITQQLQRLETAVRAALGMLGAVEAITAVAAATDDATESPASMKAKEDKSSNRDCARTSWSLLFATVRIDGAHWTHAVYYTNLLAHIQKLANAESSNKGDNNNSSVNDQLRAMAAQCLSEADAAVEASAAAVLDVATKTVGVLFGAVVDVPAASRSRMANAVAQSTSKRQQLLRDGGIAARAPNTQGRTHRSAAEATVANTDVFPVAEDVYFLDQTPIDQLRHALYAAQWSDLFGAFAYPTRYFFRSSAASGSANRSLKTGITSATPQDSTGTLPYQLTYDTYMSGTRARDISASAQPAACAPPSATSRRHRERVQKVVLTEPTPGSAEAAVPPTMEIISMAPSPHVAANDYGPGGEGVVEGATTQRSTLSFGAAVAKEEADLHNTYFKGFAAHDEGNSSVVAREASMARPGKQGIVSNDSLLRNFEAQLQNAEAADEDTSTSALQRERRKAAERQRVPDATAFAPSATRRATGTAAGAAPGANAYGDDLYGAVPSQQAFFARFQAEEED
ncbi:hypothetical protein ABL78_3450 [Leptomonas seymouri]|uniref:Uncharacterized protein n=1 Tax=Leptomonas seymouri TaxID=5684 RepID=A0A0N1HZI0_LEPSE|nr:hypothetical protein ABL78_3450 [Leptomonas seymouri]|eukprot:KPI87461.1 hypothetical protein ABL78_3450 [Leptomonas seymouri]